MTNRCFFEACLSNPKKERRHASLEYKGRRFYSYDDVIGAIVGKQVIVISDNPATMTTSCHIKILDEVAKIAGYKITNRDLCRLS